MDRFAADAWIPLRFIFLGLISLGLVASWIAWRPGILVQYHYSPQMAALTHAVVLGFLTSVIAGTLFQMVPVATGCRLHSADLAHWQWGLHFLGTAGMCLGFWNEAMGWMAWSGSCVAAATGLMIYNVLATLRTSKQHNLFTFGIRSALFWLGFTVVFGLSMAVGKTWPSICRFPPVAQMHAHVHSGILGFFILLTVAVSFRVIPAFTLGAIQNPRRARLVLLLLNLGVAIAVPSILWDSIGKLLAATLVIVGFVLFGLEVRAILGSARRKTFDGGLRALLCGLCLLVPLSVMAIILAWPGLPSREIFIQLENVYGLTALLGVLSIVVMGMLYKILPFLIWYHAYAPWVERADVPRVQDLYSRSIQGAGLLCCFLGWTVLSAGVLVSSESLTSWGWWVWWSGVMLFLGNVIGMVRHLIRPRIPLTE